MLRTKVLVTPRSFGQADPGVFGMLEDAGIEVLRNDTGGIMTEEMLAQRLPGCAGVILGVDPLTRRVLDAAPQLRAVARYGTGTDNIDLAACEARGIKVSRTLGANTQAVADCAFALMLAVARRVVPADRQCRAGDWRKTTGLDVYGQTLGLLGFGAIGRAVAARARGFGMRVLAHDPHWDAAEAAALQVDKAEPARICAEADFISLHLPLCDETRNLIAADQLALMKPTAILVNTARGGIVNEADLLRALKTGQIYGAGIDTFEQEPPEDPAWAALDNVVLGAHGAASTVGATTQMGRMAAQNLIRDLLG